MKIRGLRKKLVVRTGILLVAVGILVSCSFGHKNYPQAGSLFREPEDFVIQVDDFGTFWDPAVPARALETIKTESRNTNTIVILFIHGWHHNAAIDDDNAKDFAETLRRVREKLEDGSDEEPGPYRQSRMRLTGDGKVKVIGVYIGWRGKSLPMPLDYLTFWGRKATAERVGQGDLREFLLRLNAIYKDRNGIHQGGGKVPFMGMVAFGHSFGGQVLFRAVASTLEEDLIQAGNEPQPSHVTGFGDMVVLVNPALEALQYDRIHTLNQRLEYSRRQTPLLMVLSSETDFARQFFFPIGRHLDAVFRPSFREGQRELWTRALGEYEPQRTHTVEIVPRDSLTKPWFSPSMYTDRPCDIVNLDLTKAPVVQIDVVDAGGVQLKPAMIHHAFSPFIVAYADSEVVVKHSGIFEEALRDFLNDYVAIVEGKRMLFRDPKMFDCPEP